MFKKIFLLVFCLISSHSLFAQKLTNFISYDTMVYVYKLDKNQMNYLAVQNQIQDTSILFTHLVKTYPRSTFKDDTLPNGNFIIASIYQTTVNYRYVLKASIFTKSKVIGDDIIFFLSEKITNANIEKAKLFIDNKEIPFNDGYGGYTINLKNIDKEQLRKNKLFLSVSYGEEYLVQRFTFSEGHEEATSRPSYNRGSTASSTGYLITDKPLYKPGDTLNIKAFLTNPKNGKPIRRKARFTIDEPMQQFQFSKRLKPITPGAFVYQWKIPDTLKIDRTFNMNLWFQKHTVSYTKKSSFYLEDYLLNANKYDVSLHSDLFYAGEDIAFDVMARDANQFPLQGTLIHYKLSLAKVSTLLKDSMLLSEKQRLNWFEKDTVFPYENYMSLTIPSTILPKINGLYSLEVSFTDPNSFERKVIQKQFTKQTEKEKVLIYQSEDSVHIHCLYNLKDTARPYTIISMSNGDTLFKKKITTPYSFKLSPYNTAVLFIDKDSVVSAVNIVFNKLDITKIKGERSADSIKISFSFPFDEPVYYRILSRGKLIKYGKSRKLDFKLKDDSPDAYTILLTTNLNNTIESNYYRITYVPQKDKIKIHSSLPAQAFPGQKIPVTITATDYKNKPLSKINIAAYAVNKQFEDRLSLPQISVPEEFKDLVEIKPQGSVSYALLNYVSSSQNFNLTTHHLTMFNLQRNEYYELRYPKKELAKIIEKIQSNIPEFAVVVTHKNICYSPKYILLDGEPVYISDLRKDIYSFPAKAGLHQITFRYFDKRIELKDIQFEPNIKYWFGVNFDSLMSKSKKYVITDSLPMAQPTAKEKELLYQTLLFTDQFSYDSLYIKSMNKVMPAYVYTSYNRPQVLNVDGDPFYAFGPLSKNSFAQVTLGKKEYSLKVASNMAHYYDPLTQEFKSKNIGDIKGIIFSFSENNLSDAQLSNLFHTDTIVPKPQLAKPSFDEHALKASLEKQQQDFIQSYRATSNASQFAIHIVNDHKTNYVKSLWIVNESQPETSDFLPALSRTNDYNFLKYGSESKYDFYFLMNDEQMLVLKQISLKANDAFYVNPSMFKSEKITNDKLASPLKLYSDLTRMPLLPFYFPPEEATTKINEVKNAKRSNAYIHGMITDRSLSPLENTVIFLEVNGSFKAGATTNAHGEFELLDIPSGTYSLRIYNPSYQILTYSSKMFKQGFDYELNASLQESETLKPVLETITLDYRFMAFNDATKRNVMRVQLYDKETREPLKGASISFYEQEKKVDVKTFSAKNELDILFPTSQAVLYTLVIERDGYLPVYLHNIRFIKGLYYALHLFLAPKDLKLLVQKKEYNVNMEDVNVEIEEEEEVKASTAKVTYTKTSKTNSGSEISGRVLDERGEGVYGATIVLMQDGLIKVGTSTDKKGYYKIKSIPNGLYIVRAYFIGYIREEIKNVKLDKNLTAKIEFKLSPQQKEIQTTVITKSAPVYNYESNSVYKSAPLNYASNSVTDVVSVSAGAYQSKSSGFNVAGGRASSSVYLVDGVEYRPFRGTAFGNSYDSTYQLINPNPTYANNNMINQVIENKDISQTRKKFSDVGFWEPNHITNKKGSTSFEIRLPDNITTWKSTIIAMGKHHLNGLDTSETSVYKPLQTASIIPQFMWDQDKVIAKAKFSNLTKDPKEVSLTIYLNDKERSHKQTFIKQDYVDSISLQAENLKPLLWRASLQYQSNYKDEEEREIPVFSSAFKQFKNQNFLMDKDSSYILKFPKDVKGDIILNNTLYEKILNEINDLANYEYSCVEQTVSKLKALLCKQQINSSLGLKENLNPSIYNLINRLANYQNIDGTWGWWKRQQTNWRMTIYAVDVLDRASKLGYSNSIIYSAQDALSSNFNALTGSDKLYALYVLQKVNAARNEHYEAISKIKEEDLKTVDKIYYYKIKEGRGEQVKASDYYALYLELTKKLQTPYYDEFFHDPQANLYSAYFLFSKSVSGAEWLNVFKEKLLHGQLERNLNTFAKASMIEALTSSIESAGSKPITSTLVINDTLKVKSFPYSLPIKGSSYNIKHSGGNVFVNTAEEYWEFKPNISDSIFKVTTAFIQNKRTTESLIAGTPCQFNVKVDAYRSKKYVMLEIPIPSGVRFVTKEQKPSCSIEYFKNKIVVFYDELSQGQHDLNFELLPMLKGSFTLPASKCSLMYYPFIFGNNETRMIEIK